MACLPVADAWSLPGSDSDGDRGTSDRFLPLSSSGDPVRRRLAWNCDDGCDWDESCDHDEGCDCDDSFFGGGCDCDDPSCDDSSCDESCNSGCRGCGTGERWEYMGGNCKSDNTGASCRECDSCSSGRYRAPCNVGRCGKGSYSGEIYFTFEVCGPCTWCASCDDGTYGPRKRIGCGEETGGADGGATQQISNTYLKRGATLGGYSAAASAATGVAGESVTFFQDK